MDIEVIRLFYGTIDGPLGPETPMHGFCIKHRDGVVLVDSGMGSPFEGLKYDVHIRAAVDALADHGVHPSDISFVVNTHLHSDHCGDNIVFKHAPVVVQRSELDRARVEQQNLVDRFDYVGAKFELLEGDAELLPGVTVLATPGHTIGHQSVLVGAANPDLIVGDAAYTSEIWLSPDAITEAAYKLQVQHTRESWLTSIRRLKDLGADARRTFFCHDSAIVTDEPR